MYGRPRTPPRGRPTWWGGDSPVHLDTSIESPSALDDTEAGNFSFQSMQSYTSGGGNDFSQLPTPDRENKVFIVPVRGSETPLTRAKIPGIHGSATPDIQRKLSRAGTGDVQEVALRMYKVLKANGLVSEAEQAFDELNNGQPMAGYTSFKHGTGPADQEWDESEELTGMDYILKDGIVNYLRDVAKFTPPIPQQVVRFMDLTYSATLTPASGGYETFGNKLFNCFFGLCAAPFRRKEKPVRLEILKDLSGYIMPGSMTLLLGPPGSGKSSLLKVLGGKAQTNKTIHLEGTVLFNDREAADILLTRLIAYINGQLDKHLPFLTVRETLKFAEDCTQSLKPETFTPQMRKFFALALVEGQDPYLEYILHVLGLKGIEHQLVGAGQDGITDNDRNRLTTAEIAMGTYSVMLYDQPCFGQESLATYDLVYTLRAISRFQQCSAVMSLVQLSPEVFDLFDRVILLGEGQILYQGPRQDALNYFGRHGFKKPAHVDPGDFLMEIAAGEGAQYLEVGSVSPSLADLVTLYKLSDMHKDIHRIVRTDDVLHTFWVESEPNLGLSVRKLSKFKDSNDNPLAEKADAPEIEVIVSKLPSKVDRSRGIESTGTVEVGDVVTGISTSEGDMFYLSVGSKNDIRNRASSVANMLANARGHVRLQIERRKDPEVLDQEEGESEEFSKPFIQSWKDSTRTLISRQRKVTRRLTFLIQLRLIQVTILGLYSGTIFWKFGDKLDVAKMNAVRGVGFVSTMNLCMVGLVQLPLYMMQRPVFYKQRDQRFFRASSYVVSHALVNIPQSVLESIVYGACVYFLAGLDTHHSGVVFFEFLLVLVLTAVFGSSLVFMLSAISPILETANSLAGLLVSLFLLFSGFVIYPTNMPKYWKWVYYANPLHWANLAYCTSQIASAYTEDCADNVHTVYFCAFYPKETVGRAYLTFFDLEADHKWFWISIVILVGWIVVLNLFALYGYKRLKFTAVPTSLPKQTDASIRNVISVSAQRSQDSANENPSGISWAGFVLQGVEGSLSLDKSAKIRDQHEKYDEEASDSFQMDRSLSWKSSNIPVKPMTLSFHNLSFHTIDRTTKDARVLVNKVSGYAKSGRMLALMGGNKSGKTSLLKCLANRAGAGKVTGEIFVNGFKLNAATFSRVSGFAERLDAHQPFLTVRESLEFSASLRLGDSVKGEGRAVHIDLILDLLELSSVANQLVGSLRDPTGRTFEVAKKLTIAVELAANPSILFLDEPTSGLDSLGARNIMHAIQTIAASGRTIITTIQHPSARMLSAFNSVIILRPGGDQVYFGPVGWNCSQLLEYFASIPKIPLYDDQQNPITFVLDVLGSGIKRRAPIYNFSEVYHASPLASLNAEELNRLRKQIKRNALKPVASGYAASYRQQAMMVFLRTHRFHWRNVKYTFGRLSGCIMVGLLVGTLYFQIKDDDVKSLSSRSLFIYIQVMLVGVTSATNIVPQLGTDRLAYFREKRAGMYAPIFYPISWAIAEIPYVLIATLFLVAIGNSLAGIGMASATSFLLYWMALFVFTLTVAYFGMLVTIMTPVPMLAAFAVSIVTSVWITSSGVVIPYNRINEGYRWLYWANPFQYITNTLTATTFYCDTTATECTTCVPMHPCPTCPCTQLKDLGYIFAWDRIASRGVDHTRVPTDFATMAGISMLFATLAFAAFVTFRHNR